MSKQSPQENLFEVVAIVLTLKDEIEFGSRQWVENCNMDLPLTNSIPLFSNFRFSGGGGGGGGGGGDAGAAAVEQEEEKEEEEEADMGGGIDMFGGGDAGGGGDY